jgi:hypothetical protein
VHEVERVLLADLLCQEPHVGVHRLDPPHERIDIPGELGLTHAVHHDAMPLLFGR